MVEIVPPDLTDIGAAAAAQGLVPLGVVAADPSDPVPAGTRSIVLLGPSGGAMWSVFAASEEHGDGAPDPLDRWSARVIGALAAAFGATALFPFGGPPWMPFVAWAGRAGTAHPSPVGLLVHQDQGLMVSYRGALAFRHPVAAPTPGGVACPTCAQPCRTACPVGALGPGGYDVAACKAHVTSAAGAACRDGCLVRRACPVGQGLRPVQQSAFHMRAFTGNGR